jgi:hypothetical protein
MMAMAGEIAPLAPLATDPDGIRTRVVGVKSRCPRPLDDGAAFCTGSIWTQAGRGNRTRSAALLTAG